MTRSYGRICTFYSYKGGVGRTMALANAAFLAASSGLRVLVMDWDLEAPGLPYYFRGIQDPGVASSLKDAPGILNLAWDWTNAIVGSDQSSDIDDVLRDFNSGRPFTNCIRRVLEPGRLPGLTGALDIITAGSQMIDCPDRRTYEQALAGFSWTDFFQYQAGGALIAALRDWVKATYDIAFVDSRTGLADVAGICTMQLPDTVALCYVLNRQNIDGIARVAAAIKTARGDEVEIRPVPMRVSRENTSEESDARARATRELTRVGGLNLDDVKRDLEILSVKAASNVPFYESLAPFAVADPQRDLLTLNYVGLASELSHFEITVPSISKQWRDEVKRRLEPSLATISYITDLQLAEPSRAIEELDALLQSALSAALDGGVVQESYARALVETALVLQIQAIEQDEWDSDALDIAQKAVDLLRSLVLVEPAVWRIPLVDALEKIRELPGVYLDPSEEVVEFEEMDDLLAAEPATSAILLRRAGMRRRISRLNGAIGEHQAQIASAMEALALIERSVHLGGKSSGEAVFAESDALLLRGDGHFALQQWTPAFDNYREALRNLSSVDAEDLGSDYGRLRFELHLRMMRLARDMQPSDPPGAVEHALMAAEMGIGQGALLTVSFLDIARSVLLAVPPGETVMQFASRLFAMPNTATRRTVNFANYFGRSPRLLSEFLAVMAELLAALAPIAEPKRSETVSMLIGSTSQTVHFARRRGPAVRVGMAHMRAQLEKSAQALFLSCVGVGREDDGKMLAHHIHSLVSDVNKPNSNLDPLSWDE